MPNWVFNSLVVSGEKSELDKMVAHLNRPFTKNFPESKFNQETKEWEHTPSVQAYDNPVFAFWNIVSPTDLDTYYGKEKEEVDLDNFVETFTNAVTNGESWYYWNLRNWGTKWDVAVENDNAYSNTTMELTDDGSVMYRFETAWSPVGEALTKLSEMFPTLEFDYEYEEEQGWGGKAYIQGGQYLQTDEWDIPMCHADYARTWFSCSCEDGTNPEDAYFSDCPVDTELYSWDEDTDEWVEKSIDNSAQLV